MHPWHSGSQRKGRMFQCLHNFGVHWKLEPHLMQTGLLVTWLLETLTLDDWFRGQGCTNPWLPPLAFRYFGTTFRAPLVLTWPYNPGLPPLLLFLCSSLQCCGLGQVLQLGSLWPRWSISAPYSLLQAAGPVLGLLAVLQLASTSGAGGWVCRGCLALGLQHTQDITPLWHSASDTLCTGFSFNTDYFSVRMSSCSEPSPRQWGDEDLSPTNVLGVTFQTFLQCDFPWLA